MNTDDALTVMRRLVERHGPTVPRHAIGDTHIHAVRRLVRTGLATIDRTAMSPTPAGVAALAAVAAAVMPIAGIYAAKIGANVTAFMADRIDHVAFSAVQEETWNAVTASGPDVHDAVCAILRAV